MDSRRLTKSRQNLLAFTNNYLDLEKYAMFDTVLKRVWEAVREAIINQKTTCRFNPDNLEYTLFCQTYVRSYNNLITRHSVNMELLNVLQEEYPECTIDYLETKGQEGTIVERTFILDWSDESKA
jgi:hypothetical protein